MAFRDILNGHNAPAGVVGKMPPSIRRKSANDDRQNFSHRPNYVASQFVVLGNWARIPLPGCIPSILKMPWLKSPLSLKLSFSEYGQCPNSMNLICAFSFPTPVWCTARNRFALGPLRPELLGPTLVLLSPAQGLFQPIIISSPGAP